MKCPKCESKGFVEYHAGILQVECDECGGTGEIDEGEETLVEVAAEANAFANALMPRLEGEEWNVISIGTESDNPNIRSGDTCPPKQIPKTKKKAGRRTK